MNWVWCRYGWAYPRDAAECTQAAALVGQFCLTWIHTLSILFVLKARVKWTGTYGSTLIHMESCPDGLSLYECMCAVYYCRFVVVWEQVRLSIFEMDVMFCVVLIQKFLACIHFFGEFKNSFNSSGKPWVWLSRCFWCGRKNVHVACKKHLAMILTILKAGPPQTPLISGIALCWISENDVRLREQDYLMKWVNSLKVFSLCASAHSAFHRCSCIFKELMQCITKMILAESSIIERKHVHGFEWNCELCQFYSWFGFKLGIVRPSTCQCPQSGCTYFNEYCLKSWHGWCQELNQYLQAHMMSWSWLS